MCYDHHNNNRDPRAEATVRDTTSQQAVTTTQDELGSHDQQDNSNGNPGHSGDAPGRVHADPQRTPPRRAGGLARR